MLKGGKQEAQKITIARESILNKGEGNLLQLFRV